MRCPAIALWLQSNALAGRVAEFGSATMSANLQAWTRRLAEMQKCQRAAELVAQYGEPPHRDPQAGFEIWHYPLGVADRMLYSVHVTVQPDQSCQAYMFFEPTDFADTPAQRPKLRQSVGRGVGEALRFFGRYIGR